MNQVATPNQSSTEPCANQRAATPRTRARRWAPCLLATLLLTLPGVTAFAQSESRPKTIVAVIDNPRVDPDTQRDLQDLFLTALARFAAYDLLDKDMLMTVTQINSDHAMVACLDEPACRADLREQHQIHTIIAVELRVIDRGDIEIRVAVAKTESLAPLSFVNMKTVPADDLDALIEGAFNAAESIDLDAPAGEEIPLELRLAMTAEPAPPTYLPPVPSSPWRLYTGLGIAGVGLVALVTSPILYASASSSLDDYEALVHASGSNRFLAINRADAAERIDAIQTRATLSKVFLGIGVGASLIGGGFILWHFIDMPAESPLPIAFSPTLSAEGGGFSARMTF